MYVLTLLKLLILSSMASEASEAARRRGSNDELSRKFRKAKSKSRLMPLDELKKYEMTLSPVEKALHRNLLHLIESEAEARTSEGNIKMTEDDVHRRNELLPRMRNDNSRKKDGRGRKKEPDYNIPNWLSTSYVPVAEENPNCTQKYQGYFRLTQKVFQSYGYDDKFQRKRMYLTSNISSTEGWDRPFMNGGKNAIGHPTCFRPNENDKVYRRKAGKPVGSGFCADLFTGKACPFYPDYPSPRIDAKAHPACCDGKGCSCECIYKCSTRQDIAIMLQNNLNVPHYDKCTTSISSMNEGNDWKEEQCEKSKGGYEHRKHIRECSKRGGATCVKSGICIKNRKGKDECRFCFRWQCADERKVTLDSCLDEKCRTAAKPSRCRMFFRTFLTKKSRIKPQDCQTLIKSKRRRPIHNPKIERKKSYRRKNIPKRRRTTKNKQAGAWRRIMTRKKRKWKGKNRRRKS